MLGLVELGALWSLSSIPAIGQSDAWIWHGDTELWVGEGNQWELNGNGAGTAVLWTCPVISAEAKEALGRRIRWRWTQNFAGSGNNFSRVHLFQLPSGVSELPLEWGLPHTGWHWNESGSDNPHSGSFIHLGTSGSDDALEWFATSIEADQDSFASLDIAWEGLVANGMDALFEWHANPAYQPQSQVAGQFLEAGEDNANTLLFDGSAVLPDCIGVSAQFTGSNATDVRFELIEFDLFVADTVPPVMQLSYTLNDSTAAIQLDEPIVENSASVVWEGGDTVSVSVSSGTPITVTIPFHGTWAPGSMQMGSLHHWMDSLGNSMEDTMMNWIFIPPNVEIQRDAVITEIMADPTPSETLPPCEWVEVLNRSQKWLNVASWRWWDAGESLTRTIEPKFGWNGILGPNERCLLSGCLETISGETTVREGRIISANSFLDAGDGIGILRPDGQIIDRVHYHEDWWQNQDGGISIHRLDPEACSGPSNWAVSSEPSGASPGLESSPSESNVLAYSGSLSLESIIPSSPGNGFARFSVPLDPEQTITTEPEGWGYWNVDPIDPKILHWRQRLSNHRDSIHVDLIQVQRCHPLQSGVLHRSIALRSVVHSFPEPGQLRITEIQPEPLGSSVTWGEFVEVATDASSPGLEMGGIHCGKDVIQERIILKAGDRWVLHPGTIPNESGVIELWRADGLLIDAVRYSTCWHDKRSNESRGISLVRRTVNGPSNDARNWRSSDHALGASPGFADPAEAIDPIWNDSKPQLVTSGIWEDQRVYLFNQPVEPLQEPWTPTGFSSSTDWADNWSQNQVWMSSNNAPVPDSLFVRYGLDQRAWVPVNGTGAPQNSSVEPTSWVLNEVLSTSAIEPFIEIQNVGLDWQSLESLVWTTATIPFPNDWKFLAPNVHWLIPPGEPWAISNCPNRLNTSRKLPADMPSLHGSGILRMEHADLGHVDTVSYGPASHAPWVVHEEETSIERIQPHHFSAWNSCLDIKGSTPGDGNSWGLHFVVAQYGAGIHTAASTIHDRPALSGYRGIAIRATPPFHGNWRLTLSVLNQFGQRICEWPQSQVLNQANGDWQGLWDGRDSYQGICAPGPYLICGRFEELSTGQNVHCKKAILIAPWR